jgi:hypothetical protein
LAIAKNTLREYQQRNSPGVPLGAKKKKEKKAVTLRQTLLGIITHQDAAPTPPSADDTGVPASVPSPVTRITSQVSP